ncbi:hypothetical protein LC087_00295 [Bacillus carboniphilus]|uniref:DUF218 domain-containing protein n=1 Tax=Bacillus carboniphilus TaxID=86663 RepID=A0ABY9JVG2_9BACI|nr:hypothetical protein [Bacillus carboniphilus]WLR42728.1 hypothetical protein LC087_00295 [Bacillus carboniphilus]
MNSFVLISDPYHMARSMFIAQSMNMDVQSSPTPSTVFETWKTRVPFFLKETVYYAGYTIAHPLEKYVPYK